MIPFDPKVELCPYRTEDMREKWHEQRGIKDPEKSVKRTPLVIVPEEPPPDMPKGMSEGEPVLETRADKEKARLAAYRAANKEKLAAKARERRAKK